jgi:hypothetical protein
MQTPSSASSSSTIVQVKPKPQKKSKKGDAATTNVPVPEPVPEPEPVAVPPAVKAAIKPKVKKPKEPSKEPVTSGLATVEEPKLLKPSKVKEKEVKEHKVKEPKVKEPKVKEPKVKAPKVKDLKKASNLLDDNKQSDPVGPPGPAALKKRGRKPKGGKIIIANENANDATKMDSTESVAPVTSTSVVSSNVILHLKCSYEDMHANTISVFKYEPTVETIESYTDANDISETACEFTHLPKPGDGDCDGEIASVTTGSSKSSTGPEQLHAHAHQPVHTHINVTVNTTASSGTTGMMSAAGSAVRVVASTATPHTQSYHPTAMDPREPCSHSSSASASCSNNESLKDIWKKINKLKVVLHHDNAMFNAVQHSACFWDTCEFDTPVIHIPKLYNKSADSYTVYGCFCSPECAASYLIRESLDASVKFERLQMLNAMYNNICNNTDRPIKPAPDPRYLLNKYYGNLTVEEYRKLLKSDHLLYIVNKPLTHSLPELYDDNNEFLVNGKPATASGPGSSSAAATSVNGLGMGMGMMAASSLKNKYAFSKSALVK